MGTRARAVVAWCAAFVALAACGDQFADGGAAGAGGSTGGAGGIATSTSVGGAGGGIDTQPGGAGGGIDTQPGGAGGGIDTQPGGAGGAGGGGLVTSTSAGGAGGGVHPQGGAGGAPTTTSAGGAPTTTGVDAGPPTCDNASFGPVPASPAANASFLVNIALPSNGSGWPCLGLRVVCSDGSSPKNSLNNVKGDGKGGILATFQVDGCPAGSATVRFATHVLSSGVVCDGIAGNANGQPEEGNVSPDGIQQAYCSFTVQ